MSGIGIRLIKTYGRVILKGQSAKTRILEADRAYLLLDRNQFGVHRRIPVGLLVIRLIVEAFT